GTGDNSRVRVTSNNTSDPITVSFINAGANQTLSVAETASGVVEVTLATDGAGTITSTSAAVAAVLDGFNLTLTSNGGTLSATAASHGNGTGVVAASGAVALTSGYELVALNSVTGLVPQSSDSDFFGGSVALDTVGGTVRLLAGAYLDDPNSSDSGRAYIFELNDTTNLFEFKQSVFPSDEKNLHRNEFGL
ncbi:MAG: FG-GAP repeat protein, partial [Verrucomicrobiae bacterium]|nr:FG-GAP repeat protein [Verrucomicrobiae bacterium]